MCRTGPRRATKSRKACRNESVFKELEASKWIALLTRQVNRAPYRFNTDRLSLIKVVHTSVAELLI